MGNARYSNNTAAVAVEVKLKLKPSSANKRFFRSPMSRLRNTVNS